MIRLDDDSTVLADLKAVYATAQRRWEGDPLSFMSVRGLCTANKITKGRLFRVLEVCAENGFGYCLDSTIKHTDGSTPPQYSCLWTAEQMLSRLSCVDWRLGR